MIKFKSNPQDGLAEDKKHQEKAISATPFCGGYLHCPAPRWPSTSGIDSDNCAGKPRWWFVFDFRAVVCGQVFDDEPLPGRWPHRGWQLGQNYPIRSNTDYAHSVYPAGVGRGDPGVCTMVSPRRQRSRPFWSMVSFPSGQHCGLPFDGCLVRAEIFLRAVPVPR